MKQLNLDEVKNFIQLQSPETKIYIGADSERYQKIINGRNEWFADYILVVVVHIDGCHGCKILVKFRPNVTTIRGQAAHQHVL